jgi:gluconokinase
MLVLRFVHLSVPTAALLHRLHARQGHFMPARLLSSQMSTLQTPDSLTEPDSLTVNADRPLVELLPLIRLRLLASFN